MKLEQIGIMCNKLGCSKFKVIQYDIEKLEFNFIQNNLTKNIINDKNIILYILKDDCVGKVTTSYNDNLDIDWLVKKAIYNSNFNNYNYINFNCHNRHEENSRWYISKNALSINWMENQIERVRKEYDDSIDYIIFNHIKCKKIINFNNELLYDEMNIDNNFNISISNKDGLDKYIQADIYNINKDNDLLNLINTNKNTIPNIDNIQTSELKGYVKFSKNVIAIILKAFLNALDGRNVLNNRSFIKSKDFSKLVFDKKITLIDDPNSRNSKNFYYDFEGADCYKKYLIRNGVLENFLNNEKTSKLLGGTSGNVFLNSMTNNFEIMATNIILEIKEPINNRCDIYIDNIKFDKSVIDLESGTLILKLIGKCKNQSELNLFNFKLSFNEFLNNSMPASQNYWVNDINAPDIVMNIQ